MQKKAPEEETLVEYTLNECKCTLEFTRIENIQCLYTCTYAIWKYNSRIYTCKRPIEEIQLQKVHLMNVNVHFNK